MCILCSEMISIQSRKNMLEEILNSSNKNKEFNKFNTTSILFFLYSSTGMHGEECKLKSIIILREFIEWIRKNKNEFYIPESGIEVMYNSNLLEEVVNWCEHYKFIEKEEIETNNQETNNQETNNQETNTKDNDKEIKEEEININHDEEKVKKVLYKYQDLINKMEEVHNNFLKNSWTYYIKYHYFREYLTTKEEMSRKNTENIFIGICLGIFIGGTIKLIKNYLNN